MSELTNYQQTKWYGCTYHAFASLTQNPTWIEDEEIWEDRSFTRFRIRVRKGGWMLVPYLIVQDLSVMRETWEGPFWKTWEESSESDRFLCEIPSPDFEGQFHAFGLIVAEDGTFLLFDPGSKSNSPEVYEDTEEFLYSEYSQTRSIWQVTPGQLCEHDPEIPSEEPPS